MRVKKLLLPALIIVAAVLVTAYLASNLKVRHIECRNQFGMCSTDMLSKLQVFEGKNYFAAKRGVIGTLKQDSHVREFDVRLKLPLSLNVMFLEKKAEFAIKNSNGKYFLIDNSGQILSEVENTNLPTMSVEHKLFVVGQTLEESELVALKMISRVNSLYKLGSARLEGERLMIELSGGPEVILPVTGDVDYTLGSLVLIVNSLKRSNNEFNISEGDISSKTLDLRFGNPVIR